MVGTARSAPLPTLRLLTNQKGAVLELSGHQVGLMANVDLSGLAITLREGVVVGRVRRSRNPPL